MSVKKEPKSKKFTNKMKKKLLVIFLLVGIVLLGLSYALIRLNLSKGKAIQRQYTITMAMTAGLLRQEEAT